MSIKIKNKMYKKGFQDGSQLTEQEFNLKVEKLDKDLTYANGEAERLKSENKELQNENKELQNENKELQNKLIAHEEKIEIHGKDIDNLIDFIHQSVEELEEVKTYKDEQEKYKEFIAEKHAEMPKVEAAIKNLEGTTSEKVKGALIHLQNINKQYVSDQDSKAERLNNYRIKADEAKQNYKADLINQIENMQF